MGPAVELHAAVAVRGRFPVLAGLDLSVSSREIVLVRGPNGAGKTSLLRVCAALLPLSGGSARILGADVRSEAATVRRSVGLLGHRTFLYDDLSTEENVRFWAKAVGAEADTVAALDRAEVPVRIRSLPVSRLSTGQRRRVSIAAMVVRRPAIWLLDEPHAGLDAAGRDLVDSLVVEAAAAGATVLFASHEADRAEAVAQRQVTLAGGIVVHDTGTVADGR